MADFLLRDIDERMADRLKEIAREKGWTLNEVLLHLIKQSLGMAQPDPPAVPTEAVRFDQHWDDDEARALAEAIKAFSGLPDDAPVYRQPGS